MERITQYLAFLQAAEGLKSTTRSAWTASGRQESTAEHSWRLALFAMALAEEFPELDRERILELCLVHDLGEIEEGDVSAALGLDDEERHLREEQAVERISALLPEPAAGRILSRYREYAAGITPEARLVKALDKAETIAQHSQGANPPGFDYEFNLSYGKQWFEGEVLKELRKRLDEKTKARRNAPEPKPSEETR